MRQLKNLIGTVCCLAVGAASATTFDLDYRDRMPQAWRGGVPALKSVSMEEGVLRRTFLLASDAPVVTARLRVGDVLQMNLFDDLTLRLTLVEQMKTQEADGAFLATAAGYGAARNAVVVQTGEGIHVDVQDFQNGRAYSVFSSAAGAVVREMKPVRRPHSCRELRPPESAAPPLRASRSAPPVLSSDSDAAVDLLLAYDTKAANWARAEVGSPQAFAEVTVQKMNAALANTGLDASFRFRLAGVLEVGGSADGDLVAALHAAQGGTSLNGVSWKSVRAARDAVGADIVCILADTGSSSGLAGMGYSLFPEGESDFSEYAYNACAIRAVAQGHTLTHEVGHNMGAGHPDTMADAANRGPQYYPYSSGLFFHVDEDAYFTVMGYNYDGYGNYYSEVPYFSTPNRAYRGVAVGDATHDNARTLRQTFARTAAYRTFKPTPPKWGTVDKEKDRLRVDAEDVTIAVGGSVKTGYGSYFKVDSGSAVTMSVKGLPSGVKYVAADLGLSGKPTKKGVYYVTYSAKNKNGFSHSVAVRWFVGGAKVSEADAIGAADWTLLDGLATGVETSICLSDIFRDVSKITKFAVSGLPTGLKYSASVCSDCAPFWIVGKPTKPGKFTVTFTATRSGGKTAKSVRTVIVRDSGSGYLTVAPGSSCRSRGSATKSGVYSAGAKVSLSAKATKGNYFAGWYEDAACTWPKYLGTVDYRKSPVSYAYGDTVCPACACLTPCSVSLPSAVYARFVTAAEDKKMTLAFSGSGVSGTSWTVPGVLAPGGSDYGSCFVDVGSQTLPTLTVKGLPSGCTFDKAASCLLFKKQPKKPGVFEATVTARNLSGASIIKKLKVTVPNLRSAALSGVKYDTAYVCTVGETGAVGTWAKFKAQSGWTVTASGLPSGVKLSFDKGKRTGFFTGVPTKAGTYTVTLTVKKGGVTEKATVTMEVKALPTALVGTFNGFVNLSELGDPLEHEGTFTLTATAAGKLSAKAVCRGTTTAWTATGWKSVGGSVYEAVLEKTSTRNRIKYTDALVLSIDAASPWNTCQLLGWWETRSVSSLSQPRFVFAQRNPFGKTGGKYENAVARGIASTLAKRGKMATAVLKDGKNRFDLAGPACCYAKAFPLAFTVKDTGSVTVAGKVDGVSLSGSSVLHVGGNAWEMGDAECPFAEFCIWKSGKLTRLHVEFSLEFTGCRHGEVLLER